MDIFLSWNAPNPAPAEGYRISYWNTNTPSNVTTVTVTGTSHTLTVPDGNYAGQIWSVCGFQNESPRQDWTLNQSPTTPTVITGQLNGYGLTIQILLDAPMPCGTSVTLQYRGADGNNRIAYVDLLAGADSGYASLTEHFECFPNLQPIPEMAGSGYHIKLFSCGSQQYKLELLSDAMCSGDGGGGL